MRIFFDYQAFEMQRFGGVSRSYAELISHLQKGESVDCTIGIKESDNVHLKECRLDSNVKSLHYTHKKWFEGKKLFKGQRTLTRKIMHAAGHENDGLNINQEYCNKLLKRQQFDIFEPTFFDSYFLPYLNGKPFVLTVHDMIPELIGENELQSKQKKLLCPLAAHIHVPSENTKKDLIDIFNIPPEKITVTPHGAPIPPPTRYHSLCSFPYLLYVGERRAYKNFNPFIEECAIIIQRHPELRIVCTGRPFEKDEQSVIASLGLSEHVIQRYATEQEMQALYQNAIVFIYPSAHEGFGMPILESFVCGCPVMLNNASCFPEVGGDAAIYFDINHRGDLADHFEAFLLASEQDKEDQIARGWERVQLFSWEESAKKLSHVYQAILA